MRILVLALSGIGDALMFTPTLKIIKQNYPDAEIDALVMFRGAEQFYSKISEITKSTTMTLSTPMLSPHYYLS